jgi:hypothetical protein
MAKGSYGGGGGGLNAMSGGVPMAPPGAVAPGGGGPPPLPGAASPYGQQSGAPDPMDPSSPGYAQRMAMADQFHQNALRGNREGRAYSPGEMMRREAIIRTGAGGGGGYAPPQTTQKITPGGGNQNAFSPQAATVSQVPSGYDPSMSLRLMLAQLMSGGGTRKSSGTGDRAGFTTSA